LLFASVKQSTLRAAGKENNPVVGYNFITSGSEMFL